MSAGVYAEFEQIGPRSWRSMATRTTTSFAAGCQRSGPSKHSHMPLDEEEGGFQIFNPGSPTERRRAPADTMGLARVEGGAVAFELVVVA